MPADLTAKGELWTVEVVASDGELDSPTGGASVTIANSLPTATVTIAPESPLASEDLVATATSADADSDAVSFAWSWTRDGEDADIDGDTVPAAATQHGETWEVTIVPSDGEAEGAQASASVVVENEPPEVSSAVITPDPAWITSDMAVQIVTSDPDGDTVTNTCTWYADGIEVLQDATCAAAAGQFTKHQAVHVLVTPNDGFVDGEPAQTDPVTILNSPPAIGAVALDPTEAREDTTLTCLPSGWSDADDDSEGYALSWLVEGREVATTTTLDGASFDRGDEVVCVVPPPRRRGRRHPGEQRHPRGGQHPARHHLRHPLHHQPHHRGHRLGHGLGQQRCRRRSRPAELRLVRRWRPGGDRARHRRRLLLARRQHLGGGHAHRRPGLGQPGHHRHRRGRQQPPEREQRQHQPHHPLHGQHRLRRGQHLGRRRRHRHPELRLDRGRRGRGRRRQPLRCDLVRPWRCGGSDRHPQRRHREWRGRRRHGHHRAQQPSHRPQRDHHPGRAGGGGGRPGLRGGHALHRRRRRHPHLPHALDPQRRLLHRHRGHHLGPRHHPGKRDQRCRDLGLHRHAQRRRHHRHVRHGQRGHRQRRLHLLLAPGRPHRVLGPDAGPDLQPLHRGHGGGVRGRGLHALRLGARRHGGLRLRGVPLLRQLLLDLVQRVFDLSEAPAAGAWTTDTGGAVFEGWEIDPTDGYTTCRPVNAGIWGDTDLRNVLANFSWGVGVGELYGLASTLQATVAADGGDRAADWEPYVTAGYLYSDIWGEALELSYVFRDEELCGVIGEDAAGDPIVLEAPTSGPMPDGAYIASLYYGFYASVLQP